jgi:hypothetical protein
VGRSRIGIAAGLLVGATVVAALLIARTQLVAAPSPTPTPAVTVTATATPTTPATATAASASPRPQGLYLSKKLGYALELPEAWHKAICGDSDPAADQTPGVTQITEQFTSAGPLEEFIGDVGGPNDRVLVSLLDNPQRRSMSEIAGAAASPSSVKEVTFAGRPAVELRSGEDVLFYFIADGDRYYRVGYQTYRPSSAPAPDHTTMQRIVSSFRFLAAAERQSLPDPTPIPAAAPTAGALAGMLKTAFEQKDAAALERMLGACVNEGFEQAGGSEVTRQKFISDLRAQLANGLIVTVDLSTVRTEAGFWSTAVRSRWNAPPPNQLRPPPTPGQSTANVDLVMGRASGGFYWRGTLVVR